jgi:heavy metal translocating P-type ATPase
MEAIAGTDVSGWKPIGELVYQTSKLVDYQVIHTTIGRLRIRIPRLSTDEVYANKLNWLVESFEFVTHVRINPLAGSLVVHYKDTEISSSEVWNHLLKVIQNASFAELPGDIVPSKLEYRPTINWLERVGMPVLSLGLAFLAEQVLVLPTLLVGSVVAIAAAPFIHRTIELMLNEKRLDADLLDALWICLYSLKGDFVGPALMLSLMETGDALRDTTARVNERQILDLMHGLDQYAWVERDGQEHRVLLTEVQKGDRVVVHPGEIIPVSGRVLRGTALIDEHKLTGESKLASRSEGQVVHAATLVLEGRITILTKRLGKNTRLGLAVRLMQSAPVHDTRIEDYAAKLSNAAVAPSLLLSGLIFALTRNPSQALAPLHLDFSYALRIAIPTTVLSALTYAARQGVYIRGGRALELLARMDTIVFDKTGTLTQGNAAVVAIHTTDPAISPSETLALAAAAEQGNSHPVASAIIHHATAHQIDIPPAVTWDYRVGLGVVAQVQNQRILVGSERLLEQEGINVGPVHDNYPDLKASIYSFVYVARNHKLLGVILYTDPLRPESLRTVGRLRCYGMAAYILTGDNQHVAEHVADQLGIEIEQTYAEVFPDKKVEVILQLKDQGRTVAFAGEGINDVAALAHADVSISFASGSDIARETADVVLLDNDLSGIPHAIEIARRAMDIIYQNVVISTVPNVSVVLAGILIPFNPVLSVLISNGAALLAELNSFRPLFDSGIDPSRYGVEENAFATDRPLGGELNSPPCTNDNISSDADRTAIAQSV